MTDDPIAKARQNVTDWAQRQADAGISGSFSVNGAEATIGAPVSGSLTPFPTDMLPHYTEIMRERDRMVGAVLKSSIEIPGGELREMHMASLRASCLCIAIDIIRKKYAERKDNGTADQSDGTERNADGSSEAPRSSSEGAA